MFGSLPVFCAQAIRGRTHSSTYFPRCHSGGRHTKFTPANRDSEEYQRAARFAATLENIRQQLIAEDSFMNDENTGTPDFVRIPIFQRILDNPFILLFIGVVVPAVFYIIWGIMEIVTIPIAP
jgi:hypothetical protein